MIDYLLPANHMAPSAGTWPEKPATQCGGVSRVAKGADCKSEQFRFYFNGYSELTAQNKQITALNVFNGLAAGSE
jgi:hypothetical protein